MPKRSGEERRCAVSLTHSRCFAAEPRAALRVHIRAEAGRGGGRRRRRRRPLTTNCWREEEQRGSSERAELKRRSVAVRPDCERPPSDSLSESRVCGVESPPLLLTTCASSAVSPPLRCIQVFSRSPDAPSVDRRLTRTANERRRPPPTPRSEGTIKWATLHYTTCDTAE